MSKACQEGKYGTSVDSSSDFIYFNNKSFIYVKINIHPHILFLLKEKLQEKGFFSKWEKRTDIAIILSRN